jgi:hypothetical protein
LTEPEPHDQFQQIIAAIEKLSAAFDKMGETLARAITAKKDADNNDMPWCPDCGKYGHESNEDPACDDWPDDEAADFTYHCPRCGAEEGYHHTSDCNQFGQIVTVPPIQDSFPSVSTARGGIRYGGGSYVFPQVFNIPRSWGQGWGYPERHGRSPHASRPVAEGTPPPVRPTELMHPGVECVRNARGTCSMCGRQMARPWTHDEINRIVQLSDVNEGFDDN